MHPSRTNSTEPPKLSKSQLKKLQKQARTERRKQARAAAKVSTAENSPRATPPLEQCIARSDERTFPSATTLPESSVETDGEDVLPTPEPPRLHPESSNVPAAIKSDSTCTLFRGVSISLMAHP